MRERWVLNASPLIVLGRINLAHLFQALADEVVVPTAVAQEIEAGPENDAARRFLAEGKLPIVASGGVPASLQAWDLGAGETAVLTYALSHPAWTAILDDRAARSCASVFSVPVKGTLALVILAKKRGHISSAAQVLRDLQANGFRLKDEIIRDALRQTVNETW